MLRNVVAALYALFQCAEHIYRLIGVLRRRLIPFLASLWIARVPVASALLGGFLFIGSPEVQDLLVETPHRSAQRLIGAITFWLSVLCFWLLPLVISANYSLASSRSTAKRVTPVVIACSATASIVAGFLIAKSNLTSISLKASEYQSLTLAAARWATFMATATLVLSGLAIFLIFRSIFQNNPNGSPIAPAAPQSKRLFILTLYTTFALIVTHSFFPIDILGAVFSRASFLPLVLGIYVPILTYIADKSVKHRRPYIAILVMTLISVNYIRSHRADISTMPSDHSRMFRPNLVEVIGAWAKTNGCLLDWSACPRPVIVAASGGGSRAAFVTATTLAVLHERSQAEGLAFQDRLFAISAVSGSGLGAATYLGLSRRVPVPGQFATSELCNRSSNWFFCHDSYRDARASQLMSPGVANVQLFLSGDFITPVISRLLFKDIFSIGTSRADALEEAWSKQWQAQIGVGTRDLDARLFQSRYLADSVKYNTGFSGARPWRPLMLLTGTSVDSGHRVIASPIRPDHLASDWIARSSPFKGSHEAGSLRRIHPASFDLHELLCAEHSLAPRTKQRCSCIEGGSELYTPMCDIALSTAILNTARFPLISPTGQVRDSYGNVSARVVDGGYFDNSGLITATEFARALRAHGLDPFLIQITNDPKLFHPIHCSDDGIVYKLVGADESFALERPFGGVRSSILDFLGEPISAIINASTGRAFLAGDHARREFSNMGNMDSFSHVRICPELVDTGGGRNGDNVTTPMEADTEARTKPIAVSWWLSGSLQEYLWAEIIEGPQNSLEINRIIQVLKTGKGSQGSK